MGGVTQSIRRSAASKAYAHVILPVATFAETSGSYVNAEGPGKSFREPANRLARRDPPGSAAGFGQPVWCGRFRLRQFREIRAEAENTCAQVRPDNTLDSGKALVPFKSEGYIG